MLTEVPTTDKGSESKALTTEKGEEPITTDKSNKATEGLFKNYKFLEIFSCIAFATYKLIKILYKTCF